MIDALTLLTGPAILGLVNVLKRIGLPEKWAPLVAIALGVTVALVEAYAPADLVRAIAGGIIAGLSATGFYDIAQMVTPGPAPKRAEVEHDLRGS